MKGPRRTAMKRQRRTPLHDTLPLRTVATMSGLTPDVIRTWEKRYAVVAPIRGARGARLYTAADVVHLRRLARVVATGRAIGDVATLSARDLEALATRTMSADEDAGADASAPPPAPLDHILACLARFDSAGVTRLLGDAVVSLGVHGFVRTVALPLVHRVGALWASGKLSIAAEHVMSGALRNLIAGLLQGRSGTGAPILLATPSGERHEIGLLLVALLALEAGISVVYLGVDLPAGEIVAAAREVDARVVGLSLVTVSNRTLAATELSTIQAGLPAQTELWLGGADAANTTGRLRASAGLVLGTLAATEAELARITPRNVA